MTVTLSVIWLTPALDFDNPQRFLSKLVKMVNVCSTIVTWISFWISVILSEWRKQAFCEQYVSL